MNGSVEVAILGAGISGLAAGWSLQRAGRGVRIFEHHSRAGGPIESIHSEGFLFEKGPNTIQIDGQDLLDAFADLGIVDQLVEANTEANKRYIVRNSLPAALPGSPRELFSTPALSLRGKLGILSEPFRRKGDSSDETLAETVRRRMGDEVLDYIVNPFIAGIYAGSPEEISTRYGFPKLYELEQASGSLIKGMIQSKKAKKRAGTAFKPRLISFAAGLETLTQALANQLGETLAFDVRWERIQRTSDGWELLNTAGEMTHARELVIALPTSGLLALPLPETISRPLAVLRDIPHPPVTAWHLGFQREQVKHPLDGFGLLIPEKESCSILGVMFNSTLFPGRAPEGQVALTVFVGGSRSPELTRLPNDSLLDRVLTDLERLLGVSGSPTYLDRVDWPRAIPQYGLNYGTILNTFETLESDVAQLHFMGHIRDGIALPKCLRAGLDISKRLL